MPSASPSVHYYLPRNTDEIGGDKLVARALVTVVVKHIAAGSAQFAIESFASTVSGGVASLEIEDRDIERSDRFRPDDAILVVARLDDRGDQRLATP